jgi:glycerophosphoryl diester phosphodiesterase
MTAHRSILNIAHRGGEAHAPENTFAAFDKAPSLGTNWVETDLRVSKDGEVVLIHDAAVERTTNGAGKVGEKNVAELKALDAGSWFDPQYAAERIPTLPEFFRRYRGKLHSMLEIKDVGRVEEWLVELVAEMDVYGETVIIGSSWQALERVKSLDAQIEIGWTAFEPTDENVDRALNLGCHHIGINPQALTPEVVAEIKARGLPVRSTNVPNEAAMQHAVECGVMGMTINFPEKLAAYLRALETERGAGE